jgi:hypothetical protein
VATGTVVGDGSSSLERKNAPAPIPPATTRAPSAHSHPRRRDGPGEGTGAGAAAGPDGGVPDAGAVSDAPQNPQKDEPSGSVFPHSGQVTAIPHYGCVGLAPIR